MDALRATPPFDPVGLLDGVFDGADTPIFTRADAVAGEDPAGIVEPCRVPATAGGKEEISPGGLPFYLLTIDVVGVPPPAAPSSALAMLESASADEVEKWVEGTRQQTRKAPRRADDAEGPTRWKRGGMDDTWAPDPESWRSADGPGAATVYLTGVLNDGRKLGIVTKFRPFFEVELPEPMLGAPSVGWAKAGPSTPPPVSPPSDLPSTSGPAVTSTSAAAADTSAEGPLAPDLRSRPLPPVRLESLPAPKWILDTVVPALAARMGCSRASIMCEFHEAARFLGYVPDRIDPKKRKRFLFCRMSFRSPWDMKTAAMILKGQHEEGPLRYPANVPRDRACSKFLVYEDGIDVGTQFMVRYGLQPCGWHVIPRDQASPRTVRELLVDLEVEVREPALIKQHRGAFPDPASVPPLSVAVLDCEMTSGKPNRMPQASRLNDAIIAISVVFAWAGRVPAGLEHNGVFTTPAPSPLTECQEYERRVYVLGKWCDPIPGAIVLLFDDEFEMIAAVRDELFVRKKVDVVAGHNILRFDLEYMAKRVEGHVKRARDSCMPAPPCSRFFRFGAAITTQLELKTKKLNSSAFGSNTLNKLDGIGFFYADTLLVAKGLRTLRQNTLTAAAARFLGAASTKFDMPYALIPTVAASTRPDWWAKLAAYCVQDSVLVLRLMKKWDLVKDMCAQAQIVNVPIAQNAMSGQQVRVRNYLMRDARKPEFDMVMNGVNVREEEGVQRGPRIIAEGGWVLENVPGLHDKPVVVFDFASLYPSVQMTWNLCWSTYLPPEVVPASLYPALEAAGLKLRTVKTSTGTFTFVQNVPGVFPQSLRALKTQRSGYKKVMERAEPGSAAYDNANNSQKAVKIPMNSGYGTSNVEEGKGVMPCRAVGTVTTFFGRMLNQEASKFFTGVDYGATLLYGDTDSVMVYFPESDKVKGGTRKERLAYSIEVGLKAETGINAHLNKLFGSRDIKVEFEKVYYPFLSSTKKAYAGRKFSPHADLSKFNDNLLAWSPTHECLQFLRTSDEYIDRLASVVKLGRQLIERSFAHIPRAVAHVQQACQDPGSDTTPPPATHHFEPVPPATEPTMPLSPGSALERKMCLDDLVHAHGVGGFQKITGWTKKDSPLIAAIRKLYGEDAVGAISLEDDEGDVDVASPPPVLPSGSVDTAEEDITSEWVVVPSSTPNAINGVVAEATDDVTREFRAAATAMHALRHKAWRYCTTVGAEGTPDFELWRDVIGQLMVLGQGVMNNDICGVRDEELVACQETVRQHAARLQGVVEAMPANPEGGLDCKGLRVVRRDVPLFIGKIADTLFDALFFERDVDLFFHRIHTVAEEIVAGKHPVTYFEATAELNEDFALKEVVAPAMAVTFGKEWNSKGSGYHEGDRVPFVFVYEEDLQRLQCPPWLSEEAIARQQRRGAAGPDQPASDSDDGVGAISEGADDLAGSGPGRVVGKKDSGGSRVCSQETKSGHGDEETEKTAADTPVADAGAASSLSADGTPLPPSAMLKRRRIAAEDSYKMGRVRDPAEVRENPDYNHIDVSHYINCLCTLVEQLMPGDDRPVNELRTYGLAHARVAREKLKRETNRLAVLMQWSDRNCATPFLPVLSHRAPPPIPDRKEFPRSMFCSSLAKDGDDAEGGEPAKAFKVKAPAKSHKKKPPVPVKTPKNTIAARLFGGK